MALYTLSRTSLDRLFTAQEDGADLLHHYEEAQSFVEKLIPGTLLLAEPVITAPTDSTPGSVTWYTEAQTPPAPLTPPLSPEQLSALRNLKQALLQTDVFSNPMSRLANILKTLPDDALFWADGKIIISNWGLTPHPDGRPFSETALAQLLSSLPADSTPAAAPPPPGPQHGYSPVMPPPPAMRNASISPWLVYPAVFLLFFAVGWLLTCRLIEMELPDQVAGLPLQEARKLVQERPQTEKHNREKLLKIQRLQKELAEIRCNPQEERAAPDLNIPLPAGQKPQKPDGQVFNGTLPDLALRGAALLISANQDKVEVGSAFFITPDVLITNAHVIEGGQTMVVGNKTLGRFYAATPLQLDLPKGLDLAAVRVMGAPPQQPLLLTHKAEQLQDVIATGYPGMLLQNDEHFRDLLKGKISTIPGAVLTKGVINALQTGVNDIPIIAHSSALSQGNSGGPLMDMCGRVVGINSFITMDKETASHANYAIKADAIISVLQKAGISVNVSDGACTNEMPAKTKAPTPEQDQAQ